MCVEYLEKHLVDEEAIFEIPELEVRQWSQNIDPSSKLQMLLESQNEVTKVTSDVAKHLADIAPGDKEGKNGNKGSSVVTESQKLIETLQEKQKKQSVTSSSQMVTSQPTQTSFSQSQSRSRSKSKTKTDSRSSSRQTGCGKDETDGVIMSEIVPDSRTLSSKPSSSILELKRSCLFNFKNEGFKMMKIGVPQNVTDEFWSEDSLH